ncbi:hypothetical protein MferCBS49748_003087 [Microsporum ferrugineum]
MSIAHTPSTVCPAEADDECLLRLYTLVYEPRTPDEVRAYKRDLAEAAAIRERNRQRRRVAYAQQNSNGHHRIEMIETVDADDT